MQWLNTYPLLTPSDKMLEVTDNRCSKFERQITLDVRGAFVPKFSVDVALNYKSD